MMELKLNLTEVKKLNVDLERMVSNVSKELGVFLNRTTLFLQAEVAKLGGKAPFPRYIGRFASSVARSYKVTRTTTDVDYTGEVISNLVYAGAPMEDDVSPGAEADYEALKRWVNLRSRRGEINIIMQALPIQSTRKDGRPVKKRSATAARKIAVGRAAFFIKRKIKLKGVKGYKVFSRALAMNIKNIDVELGKTSDRILSTLKKA